MSLDPARYEIFRHRMYNIVEEGRIAMKMVSGSPVVVEGGETMCSFYTSDGVPILTAAGVLLHCTGARGFVLKAIEWYEEDPGIQEGDQFFFNDPYIGGHHLADMIVIKPIFYKGKRVAWTGSFMHTAEIGGIEPGGNPPSAKEIFHEGIRILGLKVVEAGKFRKDVFNTIVQQTRDPNLVGLDIKARVAANNVCGKGYLALIEKFGYEFVMEANEQIIADSEAMARARLRSLPDGVWRSRLYGDAIGSREMPYRIMCTATKEGDEITFDYSGSSPQVDGSINLTLSACWGSLFVVLASQLFWNVPWNGGMIAPVKLIAPEGSIVNCRFPASCCNSVTSAGALVTTTAHECIAKMLFAAGIYEDVNSSWRGAVAGSPVFGGTNQYGERFGGTILDTFCTGTGATPYRDGVDTGGNMLNPTSTVSDVEIIELNLPFLYLGRRNSPDSSGFGMYAGGMGPEMVYMVYGTRDLKLGLHGACRRSTPNWGMFGGYPCAFNDLMMLRGSNIKEKRFANKLTVRTFSDADDLTGERIYLQASNPSRPVSEYDLLFDRLAAGGGFGDPLDRLPELVLNDFMRQAISLATAESVYGVVIKGEPPKVNTEETIALRKEIRAKRLKEGVKLR